MGRPKSPLTEISGIFTSLPAEKQQVFANFIKAFSSNTVIEDEDFEPVASRKTSEKSAKPVEKPATKITPVKPTKKVVEEVASDEGEEENVLSHKEIAASNPDIIDDVLSLFATAFTDTAGELTEARNDKALIRFLKKFDKSVNEATLSDIKALKALASEFNDVDELLEKVGPTKKAEYIKNHLYAISLVYTSLLQDGTDLDTLFNEIYEDVEADSVEPHDKAHSIVAYINGLTMEFGDEEDADSDDSDSDDSDTDFDEVEDESEEEAPKPRRKSKV